MTVQHTGYPDVTLPNPVAVVAGQTTNVSDQNLTSTAKAWNFLVYLDGDNNLESYAIDNLNAMEQVGSTDQVNILVLIDRAVGNDSSNGNWTGTRLYYVTKDTNSDRIIRSQLLVDYGELDMSNPNTLRDFIEYCQTNFPATHTVLDLWDHGGGVYPRGVTSKSQFTKSKGICWDDTTGTGAWNCLTTDQVALALSQARTSTGQKLDIIATDACLMQMLEVAYEWKDNADYLVGSEETIPGNGFDYQNFLQDLTTNYSCTAQSYAMTMVDDYYNYYHTTSADTTCSVISLGSPLTTLMTAFATFAQAMNNTSNLAQVKSAYDQTDSYEYPEEIDLYGLTQNLKTYDTDASVTTAADSVGTAVSGVVLRHRETGIHVGKSYGLAILLPTASEWQYYSNSNQYIMLKLAQDTMWNEFIVRFSAAY